ncbi:lipoate--protein ligase [Paenibacillus sp. CAA11]|uniref:lipoate--protein ligase family protein n=1 Tax=Paenibacillus sp. CAA11 TaxID=1532905 RepID=UPI000D3702CE|nr:lipoate--protein ligase [Paenibacillus sp. CAA11]AWB43347.1 lipoate--protein ligase [Paenibacillus sp. CAA11]
MSLAKWMEDWQLPGLEIWEAPLYDGTTDAVYPFAWEEWMCRQVGQGYPPLLHVWRHPRAFVAGLRDRRLPMAQQALDRLRNEGWSVAVRPSGGAAVPLTAGIVNLSMILPNPGRSVNIHDDFKRLSGLIGRALLPWTEEARAGEISGAFCPGDYDLSVAGQKFCGIAQRRLAKAYIVSAFVIVEGSGDDLARQVRSFYEEAAGDLDTGYPQVELGTMGSLQELAGVRSTADFTDALLVAAAECFGGRILQVPPQVPADVIEEMTEKMKQRYDAD